MNSNIKNQTFDVSQEGREGQNDVGESREGYNEVIGQENQEKMKVIGGLDGQKGVKSMKLVPVVRLTRLRTNSGFIASDMSRDPSPNEAESAGRKRPRSERDKSDLVSENSGYSSTDSDSRSGETEAVAKRSRAKQAFYRKDAPQQTVEEEVADLTRKLKAQAPTLPLVEMSQLDTEALSKRAEHGLQIILKVASKSGNLKGTFIRALKDAVSAVRETVHVLETRTVTDETATLRADNERLKTELAALRGEFAALRDDLVRSTRPTLEEREKVDADFRKSIMLEIGGMFDAKLAGIESRLLPEKNLRPPLSAKEVAPAAVARVTYATTVQQQEPAPAKSKGKGKGKAHKTMDVATMVPQSTPLPPVQVSSPEEGWTQVQSKKKGSRKKGKKEAAPAPVPVVCASSGKEKTVKPRPTRLRPPKSEAVVLTLQPSAMENGTTYADILAQAKQRISIAELGISALTCRKTATGARILELPKASGGEKADLLAKKLAEALPSETVRVVRPVKCADLRVSGLDDSVTVAEVVEAVASVGGCGKESIRAGKIRRNNWGQGSLFLRCPIAVAKLVSNTRLLVGWVSAQVHVLPPRPMRCFRCLDVGHVRCACTSEFDRSEECFRCGTKGHKSAECSAAPHCSICAAAGRPAEHRCGAKSCGAIKVGKKKKRVAAINHQASTSMEVVADASAPTTSGATSGKAMETK